MQVKECKKMQSYKTSQVGGRASQVGGITCKEKNYRTVRDTRFCQSKWKHSYTVEVEAQLYSDTSIFGK